MTRPNDVRGFLHKRILRGVSTLAGFAGSVLPIPGLGIVSRVTGALGGRQRSTQAVPRQTVVPATAPGAATAFGSVSPCLVRNKATGICTKFRSAATLASLGAPGFLPAAASRTTGDFGDAVMGQFGAGLEPDTRETSTRLCPRGSVLATDGLCYDHLPNHHRMWPRGRRPLLTGGEMRCISIASRAANKLQRKEKQLRGMGMLPPLPKLRRLKKLPGHHAHVAHD